MDMHSAAHVEELDRIELGRKVAASLRAENSGWVLNGHSRAARSSRGHRTVRDRALEAIMRRPYTPEERDSILMRFSTRH
jgi:hypothetical protein